jgi:hypothetical protein
MLRYRSVIAFLFFIAVCTVRVDAQVLSYSTYLPNNLSFPIAGLPIAVDSAGETCAVFVNYRAGAKLRNDGSVIYSIMNTPVIGNTSLVGIDASGNCYVAGQGQITPTPGAFQGTPKNSSSPFVVKFDGSGNVGYATYLGGSGIDTPTALAVDSSGNVYLTGTTSSNDFPAVHAFQPVLATAPDLFIAVLNSSGTALIYSTYWGGNSTESNPAIAVDVAHNAYITGSTSSTDFPTVSPLQATSAGSNTAFAVKLGSTGSPVYATYLGGQGVGTGIAADPNGAAYVARNEGAGSSTSAFVSKVSADGSAVLYSASLWGANSSLAGIVVDSTGQAYATGSTITSSLPLVSAIQGGLDTYSPFISILDTTGTRVTFSTSLGKDSQMNSIQIDSVPNIYVSGTTNTSYPSNFPFPILNAPNGTYFPPDANGAALRQGFLSKISLSAGISLSHPDTVDLRQAFYLGLGQSGHADVLVANTSALGNVAISSIVISTGDFTETNNCPAMLSAASSCLVHVTFTPAAGGDRTGTITIADSAPGSPHIIKLEGTGHVPVVSLSSISLTFAPQVVGASSGAQVVTLTNSGSWPLTISSISVSGDFSETNNCGLSVGSSPSNPTPSCQISVVFRPTASGNRTGVLSIVDDASGSPHTVNLSGQGINSGLGLGVPPGGSSTAVVGAGGSASYTLTIGGSGIGAMASLSCTGAPKGAACALPSTLNISGTTPATFSVTVNTTSRTMAAVGAGQLRWLFAIAILGYAALPWSRGTKRTAKRYFPLSVVLALLLSSCAGGQNSPQPNLNGTPAGTYNLTVTATAGSNTQTTNLTLTVQ